MKTSRFATITASYSTSYHQFSEVQSKASPFVILRKINHTETRQFLYRQYILTYYVDILALSKVAHACWKREYKKSEILRNLGYKSMPQEK